MTDGTGPSRTLQARSARRRVAAFDTQFGPPHYALACHAAFPLALTPDLLYRIWANFMFDVVPWIAVADVLLSSLCSEVGRELYEMTPEVRATLLEDLSATFGSERILDLADFLLAYVRQFEYSSNPDDRDFARVQRWTALAYMHPEAAAAELAAAMARLDRDATSEMKQLASLVAEDLAKPLSRFTPLLLYAGGLRELAQGNISKARATFEALDAPSGMIEVAGVELPLPPDIVGDIARDEVRRFFSQAGFSLRPHNLAEMLYEDDRGACPAAARCYVHLALGRPLDAAEFKRRCQTTASVQQDVGAISAIVIVINRLPALEDLAQIFIDAIASGLLPILLPYAEIRAGLRAQRAAATFGEHLDWATGKIDLYATPAELAGVLACFPDESSVVETARHIEEGLSPLASPQVYLVIATVGSQAGVGYSTEACEMIITAAGGDRLLLCRLCSGATVGLPRPVVIDAARATRVIEHYRGPTPAHVEGGP